ncbi:MAG: TRAP transporter large permease subunit, partial [Paracoccaceae bacterium]|nr:TRAP transporter large permease subunit [Paracoccaceae bacterium]
MQTERRPVPTNGMLWLECTCAIAMICLSLALTFNLPAKMGVAVVSTQILATGLGIALFAVFARRGVQANTVPARTGFASLSVLGLSLALIHAVFGKTALLSAWEFAAPDWAAYLALTLWGLLLIALWIEGGLAVFVVAALASVLPSVADRLPGILEGLQTGPLLSAAFHMYSGESVFAAPLRVFFSVIVGYALFGATMNVLGAGSLILQCAQKTGLSPARMAVVGSAMLGSISGSVLSNIANTGAVTIPMMKRIGIPPSRAAAIESCASTGAVLAPPVMGATAFVMAAIIGLPYTLVVFAA